MALKDNLKYKSSAGSPAVGDIPNGGFVTSKADKRVYAKQNDLLLPLANQEEVAVLSNNIRRAKAYQILN